MARIAGVDLPRDKRIEVGLTYVYGIGLKTSQKILKATGVNPDTRVKDLSDEDAAKIREYIDKNGIVVEGDLKRDIAMNIKTDTIAIMNPKTIKNTSFESLSVLFIYWPPYILKFI